MTRLWVMSFFELRLRACLKNHSYNLHAPICGKNAKESKKVIRRMDNAQKSSKDSYNIK